MDKSNRGTSIRYHVDDYCVLDLETTSNIVVRTDIIEISAIKVRGNKTVAEFSTLVNPHCHIPEEATAVNNITDAMVCNAPDLGAVVDSFLEFIGDDVIVGYNNSGFDMIIVNDALMRLRGKPFSNDYIDVRYMAQRTLSGVVNYKLETVCKYYLLDTAGEHRALKDCYLTKDCYDKLYAEFGESVFGSKKTGRSGIKTQYTAETLALQELQSILELIIADGKITVDEFKALKEWMGEHDNLQGSYPFDRVFFALDRVLEDGVISQEELEELQMLFSDFVDPVKSRGCHEEIDTLIGKHVCVTGDFDYGNRNEVFVLIENAGGIIDKNVKKATDYVVVGAQGSDNWKTGNYGGKIQKALEMNEKGASIKIMEEKDFIPCAKRLIEENDESETTSCAGDFNADDWEKDVREMLEALISEYELPKGSLFLSDNPGQKDPSVIISHSVCIWEPDYPVMPNKASEQNKIVLTVTKPLKTDKQVLEFSVRKTQENDLRQYLPEDAEIMPETKTDKETRTVRIRIKDTSPHLTGYIRSHTEYCVQHYQSKEARFGCCSQMEACSDARKCLHTNKLYSKACMYRENLESGRIFYGKNRNTDGEAS